MRKAMATFVVGVCTIVPLLVSSVPFTSYAQTAANVQGDEFNAGSFTAPFSVQCAPLAVTPCPDAQSATTWSLNGAVPGTLRITGLPGSLVGVAASSNNARNLVLQPVDPAADYTVTTRLTFPGTGSAAVVPLGQSAGLLVYGDADHFITLSRAFPATTNGQPQIEFRQEDGSTDIVNAVLETAPVSATVYLRLTKIGNLYQASYSYDNVTFTPVAPGVAPTPTAGATGTATSTSTATVTPTLAATATPTATTTGTPVATTTSTATATSTSTPLPAGYTASYASPNVGVFAWGGTDQNAATNAVAADFDWLRVGTNSQTPVPTATNTPAVTSTGTAGTATVTNTPATTDTPTATNTPATTETSVATGTAVATSTPEPTETPAPTTKPPFGFKYVSVWYHFIHVGGVQHLQIQAKAKRAHGIWVTVRFGTGKQVRYWQQTNKSGFWQASFKVPPGALRARSQRAAVIFQLWKGSRTTKSSTSFTVIR